MGDRELKIRKKISEQTKKETEITQRYGDEVRCAAKD